MTSSDSATASAPAFHCMLLPRGSFTTIGHAVRGATLPTEPERLCSSADLTLAIARARGCLSYFDVGARISVVDQAGVTVWGPHDRDSASAEEAVTCRPPVTVPDDLAQAANLAEHAQPGTTSPVILDGWYLRTDGSYGFYVGAARAGGPVLVQTADTAAECVSRDQSGRVYEVGWPARSAYGVHDEAGNWTQTRFG